MNLSTEGVKQRICCLGVLDQNPLLGASKSFLPSVGTVNNYLQQTLAALAWILCWFS